MIKCDGLETFVENSDRVFHWVCAAALPRAGSGSPKDDCLRRYKRRLVRFASQKIRDLALVVLDMSKLADVALACLDDSKASLADSKASTGYWVELLACRFLQVKLTSSCPSYCTEVTAAVSVKWPLVQVEMGGLCHHQSAKSCGLSHLGDLKYV